MLNRESDRVESDSKPKLALICVPVEMHNSQSYIQVEIFPRSLTLLQVCGSKLESIIHIYYA